MVNLSTMVTVGLWERTSYGAAKAALAPTVRRGICPLLTSLP
jgi:hypothetical protein